MKKITLILLSISQIFLVSCDKIGGNATKELVLATTGVLPPFTYFGGEAGDELMRFCITAYIL